MSTFTFIVTEKPDAARRIAEALDRANKPKQMHENGVPYYEAQRDRKILIFPALGHLYTIAATKSNGEHLLLNYEWVPRYCAEKRAGHLQVWLQSMTKLAQKADTFIDACDFDMEGSIIGFCILKYACGGKENVAKRMKYSTLTREELERSYENLLPHLDFGLIGAGLVRHEIDWLYGINLSRSLTSANRSFGKYVTLSTGRVQGPTLRFLATREASISGFVAKPFWSIRTKIQIGLRTIDAEYIKKVINTREEAEAVAKKCNGIMGSVEKVQIRKSLQLPPAPFDLGTLQSEAYRLFGYTPIRTSLIAQQLYLDALISYPRTSSQKLPVDVGYEKIFKGLSQNPEYRTFAVALLAQADLLPVEGKKQDSAHPAIYPTGKIAQRELLSAQKNVYDLIVRRFMAAFGETAKLQTMTATLNIAGENFILKGRQSTELGWHRFFEPLNPVRDSHLPPLAEGEKCRVKRIDVENMLTRPPPRYNPASLLKKMEGENIGTKATRAGVLQTLYSRKYIRDENIVVTKLGLEIADVLREHCPSAVSVSFTRQLEKKMDLLQQGEETRENVLKDAVCALEPVIMNLKANEQTIGSRLSRAIQEVDLQKRLIGACPICHTGKLLIQVSKKTRKRFVGCSNYFNGTCKAAFPLPQKGTARPSHKRCVSCGWSTVNVWMGRKRSWSFCINPECNSRKNQSNKSIEKKEG